MIENAMIAVQDRLLELLPEKIAYLAEDWGQLDFYNERPPVNFPCVLMILEILLHLVERNAILFFSDFCSDLCFFLFC